ncbi:hypothetical protein FocnCong_v021417 [Fusarium oxysporum f. sp. conglutinans]|nr:hypothetical protein FocnCong_v021417 [Fusarium oxysporum f. sp. conglutinans]
MLNKFIDVRDRDSYSTFTSATGISILTSFLTEETDDMRKGTRPPPLNLSIVTRPRSLPRLSTTPIARELTPLLTPLPEEVEEPTGAAIRAVRVAVDFMQSVSCLLVILMLAIFLISYSGAAVSSHGIKAFILIAALTCDVGLGMWSIVHHDRPWTGPAVLPDTHSVSAPRQSSIFPCRGEGLPVRLHVLGPASFTNWCTCTGSRLCYLGMGSCSCRSVSTNCRVLGPYVLLGTPTDASTSMAIKQGTQKGTKRTLVV